MTNLNKETMKRPDINKYPIVVDGKHQYYNDDIKKYIDYLEAENKQLILSGVSQRSKLLFAFEEYWNTNNCDGENFGNVVDRFLANNCG